MTVRNNVDAALDDVSLFGGAPEPTTWAMMIGGVGATGAGLRRRRKVSPKVALA